MSVLKVIEILANSPQSWEDATQQGITEASKSVKNIRSAYVKDQSASVTDGKINNYRVTLKITFEVN
ncbi:MAG: dodecin family protein [Daejeonella sp.]